MVVIGFLLCVCLGYLLADFICPQMSRYLKVALSVLLGGGTTSLILFMGFPLHIYSSRSSVIVALIITVCIILVAKKIVPRQVSHKSSFKVSIDRFEIVAFLVIVVLFVLSLTFSTYYPVIVTDGGDYEASGRLISIEKRIDVSTYFRQQPPLVPLLYTFLSLLDEHHLKIIFPFMYISLIACFYFCLLSLEVERKVTTLFTLVLSTTPFLWWHSFLGLLNLTAGVFFSVATFFWYIYLFKGKRERNGEILLSGVLYAFSIWTRLEFLLYFTIPLLILCFNERGVNKKVISFSIFPLLLSVLWIGFYHWRFQVDDIVRYRDILSWIFVLVLLIVSAFLFKLKKGAIIRTFKVGSMFFLLMGLLMLFFNHDFYIELKTRVIETLLQPIFWVASSTLFILFLCEKVPCDYARRCLLTFIIGYLVVHIVIHTLYGKSRLSGMDFMDIVRYYIALPGNRINTSSCREYLAFYPILIFYFALSERIREAFRIQKNGFHA